MQMRYGHRALGDMPPRSSSCAASQTMLHPSGPPGLEGQALFQGFAWWIVSNLFCGDFPAVFQQAGMWQHGVSSQSEASQTFSHDKGIFISHTYSRPTFSKLSWLFFPLRSALYALAFSREEGNRNWHGVSRMSCRVQHLASERS